MQILNRNEIIGIGNVFLSVILVFLFLFMLTFLILFLFTQEAVLGGAALICVVLFFLGLTIIDEKDEDASTGRYRYEVILSDDVSFQEIHDKYKVVENRGDIWVLEDKE